ncbi:hypothetical protein BN59_00819 [Legionella massiliensis]|uniref:Uncharacterized protein n=1 Tax=Legionella massiliensis TaxID=1034943 RepID=A0A078KQ92_9GAMM|nr:hypothetical protein [Legionella massiliensis]CDZ76545.1 hypothetical protein BN59_00819 [Legionella massiliensis]CEE12283.1 hypothetical protein BN1094_00819 [Legionella massiliensis]
MPSLLDILKSGSALGTHEDLASGETVESSLEDLFLQLCNKLDPSFKPTEGSITFAIDSFDESAWGLIEQEDVFAENVFLATGTPHAKICHMRHYSNGEGAHWHALFAQMDEKGELESITITDSRLNAKAQTKQGITAQRDIDTNPFLQTNSSKIQFIPGIEQPPKTSTCWIHALANLASLATCSEVYKRQKSGGTLGQELHSLLLPPVKKEKTGKKAMPPQPNEQSPLLPTIPLVEKKETVITETESPRFSKRATFFKAEDKKPSEPATDSKSYTASLGLLFIGATVTGVATLALTAVITLSLPVSIGLLVTGLLILLVGAALLTKNCLVSNADEEIELDSEESYSFS